MTMQRIAFIWAYLACAGHGRRMQTSTEQLQHSPASDVPASNNDAAPISHSFLELDAAFLPSSSPTGQHHVGLARSDRASSIAQNRAGRHVPQMASIAMNPSARIEPEDKALQGQGQGLDEDPKVDEETSAKDNESWYGGFRILPFACGLGVGGLAMYSAINKVAARTRQTTMSEVQHRAEAQGVLTEVQAYFVKQLEAVQADGASSKGDFTPSSWERDEGKHGGGTRYGVVQTPIFNRASVNYSSVMYDDAPEKPISSATALSVIIHPQNPHAPSMHCHFSYTESRKEGQAPYWRMISDLNPSLHNPDAKNMFENALKDICPQPLFDDAKLFGDKYFFIPELNMYRGTSHLFIPMLTDKEMDPNDSRDLAKRLATATIDTYTSIIQERMNAIPKDDVTELQRKTQLAYHTAYFYQVLFLDRGTTAGIMAHSDNDVGTLASLPSYIDRQLLQTWLEEKVQPPHDVLLSRILELLPDTDEPCHVTDDIRQKLATTCREYYLEDKTRAASQADMDVEGWKTRLP